MTNTEIQQVRIVSERNRIKKKMQDSIHDTIELQQKYKVGKMVADHQREILALSGGVPKSIRYEKKTKSHRDPYDQVSDKQ